MTLTVNEAATHLGCSPRAVRAALKDGRIKGYKRGGRWLIPRRNLPVTDARSNQVRDAVEEMHDAVDEAVPDHLRRKLGTTGVAGLRAFGHGLSILSALGELDGASTTRDTLREGLRAISEGHHQFDPSVKIAALTRARAHVSRVVADLLMLEDASAAVRLASALEADVLAPIGGMIRRAERLPSRGRDD